MSSPVSRDSTSRPDPAAAATAAGGVWRFGDVRYDERAQQLTVRGQPVDPGLKALRVLGELLRHAGEVVTKDELAETCWPRRILSETALTTTVSRLRSSLGNDGSAIQTVKGYGYRLTGAVSFDGPVSAPAARLSLGVGDHPPARPDWKLVAPLGVGGQGDVWLARNGAGDERVFKFAVDLRAVTALRRESAIFRLLQEVSGDAAGAGFVPVLDQQFEVLPAFIVSPVVDGGSWPDWARTQGGLDAVPLATRLDLVAQCAEALAIAHGAGVLHKDLKPANVLIEHPVGMAPRLRLADFGSATVVDQERLRRYAMTLVGAEGATMTRSVADGSSGTPLYMAPEVLAGQVSTERSDIYALGILLYQCVIGDFRRPLSAGWEQAVDDELLREDIALCAAGDPLRRLGDAAELARRLRSLDGRRDVRRREQVAALRAAELQRELVRYRQRRKLMLWVGAVMAVALAGVSVLGWRLSRALDDARHHEALATAVNEFLQHDILAGASPQAIGKPDPTMVEVLKYAQKRIADRFAGQPLEEGAVRTALGRTWHLTSHPEEADQQLREAIRVLEGLGDGAALEAALAHVYLGKSLSIRGEPEYLEHFERAEQLAARGRDPGRWQVMARLQQSRSHVMQFSQRPDEALVLLEPVYREALERLPADDPLLLTLKTDYAELLVIVGRLDEALALGTSALPSLDSGRNMNLVSAARMRHILAALQWQLGHTAESLAMFAEARRGLEATLGPNDPEIADLRRELASLQVQQAVKQGRSADADAAIAEMRSLIAPTRAAQGELSYSALIADTIAEAAITAGRWDIAEADARAAVEENRRYNRGGELEIAVGNVRLAHVLTHLGRRNEAATLFDAAMPKVRAELKSDLPARKLAEERYAAFQAAAK